MDYHRYGSLGVGSVPPLIPGGPPVAGSGLPDHVGVAVSGAAPPPLPICSSSLLQHQHHPSLMFHYGVGGKPPSLPPHLLPSPSGTAHNSSTNLSTTLSTVGSHHSSAYATSKGIASGLERVTSTVPVLASLPPLTTTAGSARSVSPNSSSFAAALRTLAKQATVPLVNEIDGSYVDANLPCSPKTVNSYPGTSNGPGVSIPSVVSLMPSQSHPILGDVHKDVATSVLDMERLGMSEELLRGFQPYRAPDLPVVSSTAQAQLRPTMPLDLGHSYPYSSLYPHPLTHQYRLEEQLYLERYGLMRPPLPPYGIGGLSSLYQTSPYLSPRFPPEMMPNSLSVLHPSSALLHERLKLEEDMRQREYEFEMRRERELERERGREREREREKDRRQKDQHESDKREERQKASDNLRDRSPLSHSSSSMTNANSIASSSLSSSSSLKKSSSSGSSSQQQSRPSDRPKHESGTGLPKFQDSSQRPDSNRYSGSVKPRHPAIVRPFESSHSVVPPVTPANLEDKDCKVIKDTHREFPTVSNSSSQKSVWQPVQLNDKDSCPPTIEAIKSATVNGEIPISPVTQQVPPPPPLSYPNIGSFLNQPLPLPTADHHVVPKSTENHNSLQTSVIMAPAATLKTSAPPKESKLPVKEKCRDPPDGLVTFLPKPAEPTGPEPVSNQLENPICVEISSPEEPPPSPVSRLDLEERRIRALRESGVDGEEAEDVLFEEMLNCPSGFVCTKGPPVPLDDSAEKLSFLNIFDLTTHESAGTKELDNCERRAKVLEPLLSPMEEKAISPPTFCSADGLVPLVAPGLTLTEIPRLKGANSLLSDFPNKSRFLQKLGMHPQQAKHKQNETDAIWLHVLEERLRRYEKCDDCLSTKLLPTVKKLLKTHKDRDADNDINRHFKTPPLSPSRIQENGSCGGMSENSLEFFGSHAKSFGISSAKVQAALMDAGMKGLLNDGLYGINAILENDPLLSNISGIDKMIERLVKSAEADHEGKGNSLLLKHIEEVRRSQLAVCQTAQRAQEQVTQLIKTRTQLETHRASLHHHLSAVSSLLTQTSSTNEAPPTPVTSSSTSFNITSLTKPTTDKGGISTGQNVPNQSNATSVSNSVVSNLSQPTTSSPWPAVYPPFVPNAAANDTKDHAFMPIKDQKVPSIKCSTKPITTHSSSTSKVSRTPVTKAITKTIPSACVNPGKFNGATNSILSPTGSLMAGTSMPSGKSPTAGGPKVLPSTFPPVAIGAVLGMSPSSQLFYVTTTAASNNLQQRSGSQSINKSSKTPTKPTLNFTPYSKNSPSKVQNWLPNN